MHSFVRRSFLTIAAWLPRWLAVLAGISVLSSVSAQKTDQPPAPAAPAALLSANPEQALAYDKRLMQEAKTGSELMANLTYLSDTIGPRLTGSANLKRANEWAAEKMKSYGLTNVQLEPWAIPMAWERGPVTMKLIEPDNGRSLIVASAGWSPGTKGKVTGDVVVLNVRDRKELAQYKGKLKNAVVLRNPPTNVRPITDLSYPGLDGSPRDGGGRRGGAGQRGNAQEKNGKAGEKTQPPVKEGAEKKEKSETASQPPAKKEGGDSQPQRRFGGQFGELFREIQEFLQTEGVAAVVSDAGKPHGLLVTTGSWRGFERAGAAEPITTLYMAHEHYALLYRLATRPGAPKTRVEIDVANKVIPGPVAVYNTIGEIKGSEKPDEFVVLGAHIDSWDLAQGTTDNGTGTCIVLEAARMIAKSGIKPKRTIRFCLFSGEEQGLHGSRAYTTRHKDEMAKTSLCLVHDTGTGKVKGIGLQGRRAIKPIFDAELTSLKELGVSDFNLRSMGGSDHASFEGAGVPGFACQQDMSEYRLTHHSQSDTLDKANEENLKQGAQVMAIVAMRVANLPSLLPRSRQ